MDFVIIKIEAETTLETFVHITMSFDCFPIRFGIILDDSAVRSTASLHSAISNLLFDCSYLIREKEIFIRSFIFLFSRRISKRLKNLEIDYKSQQNQNEKLIEQMEKRMIDLRSQIEHLLKVKQKLDQEKFQFKIQFDERMREKSRQHENDLKTMRQKYESIVEQLKRDFHSKKSQAAQTVGQLEEKIFLINEKFNELRLLFEKQIETQEKQSRTEIEKLQAQHQKQIEQLKSQIENDSNKTQVRR